MNLNWPIIFLTMLVPTITGMIWYNPKVFGTTWMKLNGFTEEQMKQGSMVKKVLVSLIFSLFIVMALHPIVIHQMGIFSTLMGEPDFMDKATGAINPNSAAGADFNMMMEKYGNAFRTFKHGVFHGTILGIMIALPLIAINGVFERKPAKLIMIHAGYWIVTLAIMGGLISGFKAA